MITLVALIIGITAALIGIFICLAGVIQDIPFKGAHRVAYWVCAGVAALAFITMLIATRAWA